jgi:NADP-dependent alcohol dehydrogenase
LTVIELAEVNFGGDIDDYGHAKNKEDYYDTMADFMMSATMALNDFIRMGVTQDWTTHMIGHELTALHGIDHGASLSIVLLGTMKVLSKQKREKLLQYGARVWRLTDVNSDCKIDITIDETEKFFKKMGMPTRLSEVCIEDDTIEIIADRFNKAGVTFSENGSVTGEVVREILLKCK